MFALLAFVLTAAPLFAGVHERSSAPETVIFESGKTLPAQIYVSESQDVRVVNSATLLCRVLSQITGTEWKMVTYPRGKVPAYGLVVNDALEEFPVPDAENASQGFVLSSDGKKIEIAATGPLGVVHGTAAFAHELGYRRFFGSKRWEHFPQLTKVALAAKITESPDFTFRSIWGASQGPLPEERQDANEYHWANLYGGEALETGHMYEAFISARKAVFDKHPEYYALVKGSRTGVTSNTKLCISNPGLREEMVSYIRDSLRKNPVRNTISMDPSDGGNWCECQACAEMGSISTRVVTLANQAARMIREEFPGKKIGIYAYASHSPPPEIRVEPEVVVCIATAFIREGWTYKRLEKAWQEKGAVEFGTRDYHDVVMWSGWWRPGSAKATDTLYCTEMLKAYYDGGARYFTSEGGWVFAPNGLGYYLSMRTLWNVEEATRRGELQQDFLQTMFGPAAKVMEEYFELVDGKNKPLLSEDLLGRMYRHLADAFRAADGNPAITRRVADMALYVRHCELLLAQNTNSTSNSQKALLEHLGRARTDQVFQHRTVLRYGERVYRDVCATVEWDNLGAVPYTIQEIISMVSAGVEHNKLLSFKPVKFTDELRPFPITGTERFDSLEHRGRRNYYTFIADPSNPIVLKFTGGLIYRDRGNVRAELYQIGGASETGERITFICEDTSTPPDRQTYSVSLKAREPGLHKIVVDDGDDKTKIEWSAGTPFVFDAGHPTMLVLQRSGGFYFYIPPGTKVLGFYARCRAGGIHNSAGEQVLRFTSSSPIGYFALDVPVSEGGKLWSYSGGTGDFSFLTVPPVVALSGDEMMLPLEVIPPK